MEALNDLEAASVALAEATEAAPGDKERGELKKRIVSSNKRILDD